jgi:hypothetical protein
MTTFATPVQQQTSSKWEPWVHNCGFGLVLRLEYNGVQEMPVWMDGFNDLVVTECPKCTRRLNMNDGG